MTSSFPVLSQGFVLYTAIGLADRGHEVHVLVMDDDASDPERAHPAYSDRGVSAWVHRPYARLNPLKRAASGPRAGQWRYSDRALAFGAQALAFSRVPTLDVLHFQFATVAHAARSHLRARTLRSRRRVIHVRGFDITSFVRARGEDVFRDDFDRADLVIANCRHFERRARQLGAPRTAVVGSPVDFAQFPRKPRGEPGQRLITVGRLVEKKGLDDLVTAMTSIVARHPDATLQIIGGGPLEGRLRARISSLGLEHAVTLTGPLPHDEVSRRLARADLFFATSVRAPNGDEDAPVNTLKEAMAIGLPVVATRHGGIPELVIHEKNGLLVPEHAPSAIAEAASRLLSDPSVWDDMGDAGRAAALASYDVSVVSERLESLYHSLLARSRPRTLRGSSSNRQT